MKQEIKVGELEDDRKYWWFFRYGFNEHKAIEFGKTLKRFLSKEPADKTITVEPIGLMEEMEVKWIEYEKSRDITVS